ncbi:MAG: hypothetical protein M1819_004015 [Sarea resinae]|nr:MAG: hypothetical protein M1819_004015 [Sarea resinae]
MDSNSKFIKSTLAEKRGIAIEAAEAPDKPYSDEQVSARRRSDGQRCSNSSASQAHPGNTTRSSSVPSIELALQPSASLGSSEKGASTAPPQINLAEAARTSSAYKDPAIDTSTTPALSSPLQTQEVAAKTDATQALSFSQVYSAFTFSPKRSGSQSPALSLDDLSAGPTENGPPPRISPFNATEDEVQHQSCGPAPNLSSKPPHHQLSAPPADASPVASPEKGRRETRSFVGSDSPPIVLGGYSSVLEDSHVLSDGKARHRSRDPPSATPAERSIARPIILPPTAPPASPLGLDSHLRISPRDTSSFKVRRQSRARLRQFNGKEVIDLEDLPDKPDDCLSFQTSTIKRPGDYLSGVTKMPMKKMRFINPAVSNGTHDDPLRVPGNPFERRNAISGSSSGPRVLGPAMLVAPSLSTDMVTASEGMDRPGQPDRDVDMISEDSRLRKKPQIDNESVPAANSRRAPADKGPYLARVSSMAPNHNSINTAANTPPIQPEIQSNRLTSSTGETPMPRSRNKVLWSTPAFDPSVDPLLNPNRIRQGTTPGLPGSAMRPPASQAAKPWTSRMYADLMVQTQQHFPFRQFADKYSIPISEVFDTFSAIVQMPILQHSEKGLQRLSAKVSEKCKERVDTYKDLEKQVRETHLMEEKRDRLASRKATDKGKTARVPAPREEDSGQNGH